MIRLRILDVVLSIHSDDESLLGFLGELWQPFVDPGPGTGSAIEIGIDTNPSGWILRISDGEPHQMFDPWVLALDLRSLIDDLVIGGTPGVVDLHAAMALVDDAVVLFPGDPGAGKTTLVLEGLQSGWRLFSDDLSLLEVGSHKVIPLPRPIGIRAGVPLSRFAPMWRPPQWLPEPSTPYVLPAGAFPLVAGREPVSPGYVVFPRYDTATRTSLTLLSRGETVARIGRHLDPLTPDGMRALKAMCVRVVGADMTYQAPEEGVEAISRAIRGPER